MFRKPRIKLPSRNQVSCKVRTSECLKQAGPNHPKSSLVGPFFGCEGWAGAIRGSVNVEPCPHGIAQFGTATDSTHFEVPGLGPLIAPFWNSRQILNDSTALLPLKLQRPKHIYIYIYECLCVCTYLSLSLSLHLPHQHYINRFNAGIGPL